jgi:hypothetical protein
MTSHSKVIRFVHKENMKWLPDSARIANGGRQKYQEGLVRVELDFYWIRNNTGKYERLMGRQ